MSGKNFKKYKNNSIAMINDIQKRLFLTKKLVELKSVRLVQKSYRSKFKNRSSPTAEAITKLSKKFDTTGTILDLPPRPKKEREISWETSWVDARNKLKVIFSDDPRLSISWCWHFIQSLPWYSFKRFAIQIVQIPECSSTVVTWLWKKGHLCSMVAGLGKGCSQMVDRFWWTHFYLTKSINNQNNRMWLNKRP